MLGRLDKIVVLVIGFGGGRSARVAKREPKWESRGNVWRGLLFIFGFFVCHVSSIRIKMGENLRVYNEREARPFFFFFFLLNKSMGVTIMKQIKLYWRYFYYDLCIIKVMWMMIDEVKMILFQSYWIMSNSYNLCII